MSINQAMTAPKTIARYSIEIGAFQSVVLGMISVFSAALIDSSGVVHSRVLCCRHWIDALLAPRSLSSSERLRSVAKLRQS